MLTTDWENEGCCADFERQDAREMSSIRNHPSSAWSGLAWLGLLELAWPACTGLAWLVWLGLLELAWPACTGLAWLVWTGLACLASAYLALVWLSD